MNGVRKKEFSMEKQMHLLVVHQPHLVEYQGGIYKPKFSPRLSRVASHSEIEMFQVNLPSAWMSR